MGTHFRRSLGILLLAALLAAGCERKREVLDVETPEGGIEVKETDEGLEIETQDE